MWRKTRSPTFNAVCFGVDTNRNWDSHWAEPGASRPEIQVQYLTLGCQNSLTPLKVITGRKRPGIAKTLIVEGLYILRLLLGST